MKKRNAIGILFTIGSAVLYGICAVLTKYVSAMGLSVAMILIGRGIVGTILAFAGCVITKTEIKVSKDSVYKVLVLGLFGMCATLLLLNVAYTCMPVGTVTTIHYLYPVLVCVATGVVYREKPSVAAWATIVMSFAGIVIMSGKPQGGTGFGVALAVLSAVTWTFYMLYMERSGVLKENKLVITMYLCLIISAVGLAYGGITDSLNWDNLLNAMPIIIVIGLMNNIFASILIQKGIERIGAGLSAIFSVFEPIASIGFGTLIMKEVLTARQVIGCGIILTAIVFLMLYNTVSSKKQETKEI